MSDLPVKITIVIPVYNVEKYLRQCLDSVVNQTMREIQVICVNDGSTDTSLAILREYAAKDERIIIIDKPNGGVAAARNAAYPYIRGIYTSFIDLDDWIEPNLCEKVYEKAEASQASITIFSHQAFYEGGGIKYVSPPFVNLDDKTTDEEKCRCLGFTSAWNKLWQTSFLNEHRLYFHEGLVIGEDTFFMWRGVTLAEKISIVPEILYHYRVRPGSAITSLEKNWRFFMPHFEKIYTYLIESGYYTAYRAVFVCQKMSYIFGYWKMLPPPLKQKFVVEIRKERTEDDREFLRTSPKKLVSKEMRLFYEMIDGGIIETVNYKIIFPLREYTKIPERILRQRVIKPLIKRLKAA